MVFVLNSVVFVTRSGGISIKFPNLNTPIPVLGFPSSVQIGRVLDDIAVDFAIGCPGRLPLEDHRFCIVNLLRKLNQFH